MSVQESANLNHKPMSLHKRFLLWLFLIAFSLALSFLACEIVTRIVAPQPTTPRWHEFSEHYGLELKKGFHQEFIFSPAGFVMDVTTNSHGHRDLEEELTFPFAGETVLFLGDSFTFGYANSVEDRMDRKLAARCESAGVKIQKVNAGTPGWGTLQELACGKSHLQEYNPDTIVLTFCGNDPIEDDKFLEKRVFIKGKEGLIDYPGKTFLQDHLHFYRFLLRETFVLRNCLHFYGMKRADPKTTADRQSGSLISEAQWERTLSRIRQFAEEFKSFKPTGLVLVQATDPVNEEIRSHLQTLDNGQNLVYVDLYEATAKISPDARRLPFDNHWSALMHYVSAEHLFNVLKEKRGW